MLILALLMPLLFNSCSKNEGDDNNDNSIIGTWEFNSVYAGEIKTNNAINTEKIKPYVISSGEYMFKGYKYVFKEKGKLESSFNGGAPTNATYTYSNGILTAKAGNQTLTIKASISNGFLQLEQDFTEDCNNIKLKDLIELGIDDINFKATKAIAIIYFKKQ